MAAVKTVEAVEAVVNITVQIHGFHRLNAVLYVLLRVGFLLIPAVLLLGARATGDLLGQLLFKLLCRVEVVLPAGGGL